MVRFRDHTGGVTQAEVSLGRETRAVAGEELVEKQNADVGLLPLVADESHHYGYQEEKRHMTAAFAQGRGPAETLNDGLLVSIDKQPGP